MAEKLKGAVTIVVITVAIVIACLIVWQASEIFLLGFAALLLSLILSYISRHFSTWFKIPYAVSLILVVLILIFLFTLVIWIAAPLITYQVNRLIETVPQVYSQLTDKVSSVIDLKVLSKEKLTSEFLLNHEKIFNQVSAIFSFTVGTITSFAVFGLVGLYLAINPELYLKGFLFIFRGPTKLRVESFLIRTGSALRWWLLGKFISMTIIGISSMVGLWILQVPLAFVLGLLAALLTFIPYLGAIVAGIPAVLIALSVSPLKALYVVILYIVIHAIESYLISPFVDQKTVSMPPALTIMAQVLLAFLLGFFGLAIASPLTVVALIFISEFVKRKRLPSLTEKN